MNSFPFVIQLIIFLFGAIIGSFLNVVIYRYNTGRTLGGRSICMSCGKTLRFFELIPVISWLVQAGKCVRCRSIIPFQYPLVEAVTGLLFLGVVRMYAGLLPNTTLFLWAVIPAIFLWCMLVIIAVYDIRHKIIPDLFVYLFIIISALLLFITPMDSSVGGFATIRMPATWDILSGFVIPLPFALLWYATGGRVIGFGDIKLMMGIGFFLGLGMGIAAVMLAFWIGALVGVFLLLVHGKDVTMKTQIPFGPFLIIGIVIAYFCQLSFLDIASWFTFFS